MHTILFKIYVQLITMFILLSTLQLKAQVAKNVLSEPEEKTTYSVSILTNGIFKNPGLNFRYERPILFTKKETPKRKIRELNMSTNLGFYWDPYTHIASYANAGILFRKTNKKNRQWMLGLNPLGYMRTFVHEAYEVDDNLTVTRKRFAGRSYYAPELIIGTGKFKNNKARFFNIHLMFLRKYNTGSLPLIHFEFGYRF